MIRSNSGVAFSRAHQPLIHLLVPLKDTLIIGPFVVASQNTLLCDHEVDFSYDWPVSPRVFSRWRWRFSGNQWLPWVSCCSLLLLPICSLLHLKLHCGFLFWNRETASSSLERKLEHPARGRTLNRWPPTVVCFLQCGVLLNSLILCYIIALSCVDIMTVLFL